MKQNLLLVTEHYPCGTQEGFLESEIEYLKELYRVHVITTDTDRLMTRALPKGVVFSRPAEKVSGLRRFWTRLRCLFSRGYLEERKAAKAQGRFTPAFRKHTLNMLVKSRLLYDYIRNLDFFQREEPLLIYSANLNDYLYGLCCLKSYSDDIRVVARCHNANMFNPRSGRRRDTLNHIVNQSVDALYFASEHARQLYLENFSDHDIDPDKLRVARLGVPGQEREDLAPLPDFYLRIVTCCPMEDSKRLPFLIDALSMVRSGGVEWIHIGSGSKRQEIQDYAQKQLGDKNGVRYKFFGKMSREEIYRYYRENYVDLFLSVSLSENVPTAMMEAMANRIFVAAVNVDGVSDVVDNENGVLFPSSATAEQLSRAIDAFARIPKVQIAAKGRRAFRSWQEKFDAESNCAGFAETLALLSGQTPEDIAAQRREAHSKALEMERRRPSVFEPLQTPASAAGIHEMPVSFMESLKEDGILSEEEPIPLEEPEETPEDAPAEEPPEDIPAEAPPEGPLPAEAPEEPLAQEVLELLEEVLPQEPGTPPEPAEPEESPEESALPPEK